MWNSHLKDRQIGFQVGGKAGDSDRPTLLMIHGAGGSALGFLPQLSGLSRVANTAAIDLPGHGDTPGPGCSRIDDYADWLMDFLEDGPVRPVLMGHSMGGAIAMTVALNRPDLLRGVVLLGTGAKLGVLPAILSGIKSDFMTTVEMIVNYAYAPGADQKMIRQGIEMMARTKPQVLLDDFTACNEFDVREKLKTLNIPCLVLVGSEDRLTPPSYSRFLNESISGSKMAVIAGGGHMVNLEKYKEINRALREFLA